MKMNDTVARIVEIMFQDVEMNEEVAAIRDEVMNNCQERYNDLVSSGLSDDDAIAAVIESLKGMEDVIAPYKRRNTRNTEEDEEYGVKKLTFSAQEIHQIDLTLVDEDVTLEPSWDDDYHVVWDKENHPLLQVKLEQGVLRIERGSESVKKVCKERIDRHFNVDTSEFIKTEEGKIQINMDGLESMFKSLGDSLKTVFNMKGGISISMGKTGVTIQVPERAIPHVKLLTTSGDIEINDVALTALNITSTSGDVTVDLNEDQHMQFAEVRTTSGDIEATAFTHEMTIASTSGDVEVEGDYHNLTVNTISGDIDVRADVKNITFKAVSGDVDLEFNSNEIRDISGSTISGDIEIELPDGIGAIAINTQTRSGDVTTRHSCDGVGPTVSGIVHSMSGDITIS